MPAKETISTFSPQRTKPEVLEKIFVQREPLLAKTIEALRESVLTKNKHHFLFVGPRGTGKTHLLTLIHHRLSQDEALHDKLRFAWLNEDETSTTFFKFLLRIYRELSTRYPEEFPKAKMQELAGKSADEASPLLQQALLSSLAERTLVLLVENLDALFTDFSPIDQRAWRAFVQNHPVFATVGSAQRLVNEVAKRDHPFFGFFDLQHLPPLSVDGARELLEKLAELHGENELQDYLRTAAGRARLLVIHRLAGGNARLYIIFSDFLTRDTLDDLVGPFEETVDKQLTPYYQERMRWLSPQQREIVQFLCQKAHPMPVKAIAEALFVPHGSVTGQLKQLRELGYVQGHEQGREVLYELAEPLMRLALQVKETHDRQPLTLIVDFLRVWFEPGEIEERLRRLPAEDGAWSYFAAAKERLAAGGPNLRHELLRQDLAGVDVEKCGSADLERLRALAEETNEAADWVRLGDAHYYAKGYLAAIAAYTRVFELRSAPIEILAKALGQRGIAYGELGRNDEAITDFIRVIDLQSAPIREVTKAFLNRGVAFGKLGRCEEEIADYTHVVELPSAPVEGVARALNNRGFVYAQLKRIEEAIADWTRVAGLPFTSDEEVAMALNNRGVAFRHLGRHEEEIADYTRVVDLPSASVETMAMALQNRGSVYVRLGRIEEAIADYSRVLELPSIPPESTAMALNNRGVAHGRLDQVKESIADYSRVLELSSAPVKEVARALYNRGVAFERLGRHEEAVTNFARVVELSDAPIEGIVRALCSLGIVFYGTNRHEAALEAFSRLLILPEKPIVSTALQLYSSRVSEALVASLFAIIGTPEVWLPSCRELVAKLGEFSLLEPALDMLAPLGKALVQHLPKLGASLLAPAGLDVWVDGWEKARWGLAPKLRPALKIPLRILRTGVEYLKTKDEGALLALAKEERGIAREALGLAVEESRQG